MRKTPLIETNPYLRDPERYRNDLINSVASSTAIETGAKIKTIARTLKQGQKAPAVRRRRGSAR